MNGWIEKVTALVVGSIPPPFLILCAINVAFLWTVLRFLDDQNDARIALVNHLIDHCQTK